VSLLGRARQALEDRQDLQDGYAQLHRDRNRDDVVRWVCSTLECVPGEIEGLEAVAGRNDSSLWRFKVEGLTFLAGTAWCKHPGPPGRKLFLGLLRSPIRGRYSWPPDVDHDDSVEVPGTVRIRSLADLAEAVDKGRGQ
jgi:hypothetical protein